MEIRKDDTGSEDNLKTALIRALHGAMIGCLVTIPAGLMAISSGGAGHGNYVAARLFYPVTCQLIFGDKASTFSIVLVSILQFPIYGLIIGLGWKRKGISIFMAIIHLSLVVIFTNSVP